MKKNKKYLKEGETYEDMLRRLYPLEHLEKEFEKIESLGYTVNARDFHCLIFKNPGGILNLIIDSDFYNDYHLNAAGAIHAFWVKE